MYFHTDDPDVLGHLGYLLTQAAEQGGAIRMDVSDTGALKVKAGGGMWSPPIRSTFDLSRDAVDTPVVNPVRLTVGPDGSPVVNL